MIVHVFTGPDSVYAFTEDSTGSNLPSKLGAWTRFKKVELKKDVTATTLDTKACVTGIKEDGYYISKADIPFIEAEVGLHV